MPNSPLFLVLDGIDGCGKTTQASKLVERLARGAAKPPLHLREPGSTAAGERIRELVLSREQELDAGVELLLFAAARRQMLAEIVAPALSEGRDVVCERFHASTFAYQAVAGGLPERDVLALLARWAGDPAPDAIVVIDVAPERAASRRSRPGDRIEAKGIEFQRRVAEGYRRYVELEPLASRVDGDGTVDEVARRIAEAVGLG
jgi:dTMP kinase